MKIHGFRVDLGNHRQVQLDPLQSGLNVIHAAGEHDTSHVFASLADRLFGTPKSTGEEATRRTSLEISGGDRLHLCTADTPLALGQSRIDASDLPLLRSRYSLASSPPTAGHLWAYEGNDTCICGETHVAGATAGSEPCAGSELVRDDVEIQRLEEQCQRLRTALQQGNASRQARQQKWEAENRQLAESIHSGEQQIESLSAELDQVEQRIKQIENMPADAVSNLPWLSDSYQQQTRAEIKALRAEIDRWQYLAREARERQIELEQQVSTDQPSYAESSLREAQRTGLAALCQHSGQAQASVASALCNFLTASEQASRSESLQTELAGVRRATAAIFEHVQWLQRRHFQAATALDARDSLQQLARRPADQAACRCDDREHRHSAGSSLRAELIELQTTRQRLVSGRQRLRAKLESWKARRAALDSQRGRWQPNSDRAEIQRQLAHCEQELTRLHGNSQRKESQPLVNEHQANSSACAYLQRASQYLQELTGGYLTEIAPAGQAQEAEVADFRGEQLTWQSLSVSGRNMVQLSLSLAAVEAWESYGIALPLLLDDPFVHLKQSEIGFVAEVLQRFAHADRQVLLFADEEIATGFFSAEAAHLGSLSTINPLPAPRPPLPAERATIYRESTQPPVAGQPSPQPATCPEPPTVNFEVYQQRVAPVARSAKPIPVAKPPKQEPAPMQASPKQASPKKRLIQALQEAGIDSTEEFLQTDPSQLAEQLSTYTADELQGWQDRIALLHYIDDMTDEDIDLLDTLQVSHVESLGRIETNQFHQRMLDFLRADRGIAFRECSIRYGLDRVRAWRRSATEQRSHYSQTSYGRRLQARREAQSARPLAATPKTHKPTTTKAQPAREAPAADHQSVSVTIERRFYLELESPVVDAPSIGPKMASRLDNIGVYTVADLLQADAAEIASRLKHNRTKASKVKSWQQQSRLVCRIPQLRGHDAQILVALDYTEPEQIASTSPEQLFAAVKPFAESKEGQRVIRKMNPPDLVEVTQWINWACNSRQLRAA